MELIRLQRESRERLRSTLFDMLNLEGALEHYYCPGVLMIV